MLFNNVVIIFIILIFVYIITYQFIPDENLVSKDHYIQSNILSHTSNDNVHKRQYVIDNQEGTFMKKEYDMKVISHPRKKCIGNGTYDRRIDNCSCPPGFTYDETKGCTPIPTVPPILTVPPIPTITKCNVGYTLDKTLNTCVSLCSSNEHFDPINNVCVKNCLSNERLDPINNVCVADCQYGDWDSWSSCVSGSLVRTRTRKTTAPKNGGNTCAPGIIETDTSFCPINCSYGTWGNWSSCLLDNSTATRTRITYQPINNGTACGPGSNIETDNSHCTSSCKYGAWSDWSACQSGTRTRTRTLTQPINGGAACPISGTTETQTDSSTCPNGCQYGAWSEWSACQAGTRTRTRTLTQPINGGAACPVSGTTETQTDSSTCPNGCKYGDWSAWSGCQSGNSTRTRTLTQPINGGAACPVNGTTETQTDSNTCILQYIYLGEGGCTNDRNAANNTCKNIAGSQKIGQQSNGCWHCLKTVNSGGNKTVSGYPRGLFNIDPYSTTNDNNTQYVYLGEGGCIDDMNAVYNTCKKIAGTDTIGQQLNGCWHCLKTVNSGGGQNAASGYPRGLFNINTTPVGCQYGAWSGWSGCESGNARRTRTRTLTQPINGGAACPVSGNVETDNNGEVCAWFSCDDNSICNNRGDGERYCRVGDKRCLTDADCDWANRQDHTSRDCRRIYQPNVLNNGDPVMCTDQMGTVYRYMDNNVIRGYPSPEVASSWDPNWGGFKIVNCKNLKRGSNLDLINGVGGAIMCNNAMGTVYRYMGNNVIGGYPSPEVASSWDPNWGNYKVIDCSELKSGGVLSKK